MGKMEQKGFWQYERWVWSRGWSKFLAGIGWVSTVLTIGTSIITAFVIQFVRSDASNVVGDAMIGLGVLLVFCLFFWVVYVSRESFIVNDEQIAQIFNLNTQLTALQDRQQAAEIEDILSDIERIDVDESHKVEGIKRIEAMKASRAQRARAAVVSFSIWREYESRANSDMFDVSRRKPNLEIGWVHLEAALRLDPGKQHYQRVHKHFYPERPITPN
jgi:hypothetical protein